MEGRFEFMQHFIALGFIKVGPWNLRKKQANGWDRVNIYFNPEDFLVMVTVDKEVMKFSLRYDQFKDAPTAYNALREYFRSCFIKSVENKLNEIL
ncbi:hypothetical protein BT681P4_00033 [Bacteroides phage BT681P4]|nr:hypothetical protein BT681P2_00009 [Bacteroides phage BT681P2]WAX09956.1 hypothetical protein BT681P4_00033 [Bacteroides phage BT681P4]